MPEIQSQPDLDRLERYLDDWLGTQLEENPAFASVERDGSGPRRWVVRIAGEDKEFSMVKLDLGQRSLYFETYVMPWPIENEAEFFAYLLRRNHRLFGAKFSVGAEDGIYLEGHLDSALLEQDGELDRVFGSIYTWVEQFFHNALRIGFASKFS